MVSMRMKKSVVALLLVAAAGMPVYAQAEPKTPAVVKAKQAYDAAVKKAEAEVAAAQQAYLAALDASLKVAMGAGDLDEANRIDAVRKAVRGTGGSGAAAGVSAGVTAAAGGPGRAEAGKVEPAEARRKPGWIVGAITDSAGKPISGVTFEVNCFGTTIRGGERASFQLEVDEQGRFSQELPEGLYAVTAYLTKDYEGSRFRIQLHAVDEKPDQTKVPSKAGIVKDFVWKLTGVRPGGDPKQTFAHHGGSVRLYDSQYLGDDPEKLAGKFPADTQAVVTLTPRGPLIDGSKGSPVEIKAPLATIGKTLGHVALDIPLGSYTATVKAVTPGGEARPLKISTEFRGPFKESAEFVYQQPGIYDSVKQVSLYVNP